MSTPHVCSVCRRNLSLATIRRHAPGQLRSRSTFVSLATNTPSATGDKATDELPVIRPDPYIKDGRSRPRKDDSVPRKARSNVENRPATLEALFEDYRKGPSTSKKLPNPSKQSAILALYEHIETLKLLLSKHGEPIDGIWRYFVSHLSASAWNLDTSEEIAQPFAFNAVTGTLLRRLQMERTNSQTVKNLPTVTQIISVFASLGQCNPSGWKPLIYDLLRRLSEQKTSSHIESSAENLTIFANECQAVSEDVLGAWKVLCEKYSLPTNRKSSEIADLPDEWRFLSPAVESEPSHITMKGGPNKILLPLWPNCPGSFMGSMSTAALATFAILTDGIPQSSSGVHSANPFITSIARLLVAARCNVKDVLRSHIAEDVFVKDLNIDWPSVLQRAGSMISRPAYRRLDFQHTATRPLGSNRNMIFQNLARATTLRDLREINNLWIQAKASAQTMTHVTGKSADEDPDHPSVSAHAEKTSQPNPGDAVSQELCNRFIQAFMALGQPDLGSEVWNFMIETSRYPNLSTWHAMLEGCRRARNPTSLEAVWSRLISSTQPDVACWRTRISTLIECGKPELAIRALDEMGRIWSEGNSKQHLEKRETSEMNGPVKPTIEILNDAISGLLNRRHLQAATRVLAWGDKFGIKPDIVTYNILIRGLVRDGRIESVPPMLAQMQKQGIQADVATFTTILDEIFRSSDSISPKEQLRLTDLIFAEMEAAGVQPNRFTYNRIISSLLQTDSQSSEAVQAVLARMASQKIEPSKDIYTMFIKHLFSQDPPDFHGVRSILDRIRMSGAVVDHIFWDRVIEGYASVGDTSSALALLGRIDKEGSRVGWVALKMVLRALAANDEWDLARQVVRNVKMDRGGPPDVDQKGIEGQHAFWRTVEEFDLMDT